MNFEKSFGTFDIKSEAEWFTHEDGGEFLVAPMNNNLQVQETMKLTKMNDSQDDKTLYDTKELSCKVMAKSILLDWKNVEDGNAKELKYSTEIAEQVLINYNDFSMWIMEKSNEVSEQTKKGKEKTLKN